MNFLAHLYLSTPKQDFLLGNFVADAIKGKKQEMLSGAYADGIAFHHFIDDFTDQHEVNSQMRQHLRGHFHKFSGVVLDIYYDHFLAKKWDLYSEVPLWDYSREVYLLCLKRLEKLPEKTQYILPYMVSGNWLYNYANFHGMQRVFRGMSRRTRFKSGMENAVEVLKMQYSGIEEAFETFFPKLEAAARQNPLYLKNMR